ncbi:MAG: outer membrane beta-barrel protein [Phycisphaerales bacterium]
MSEKPSVRPGWIIAALLLIAGASAASEDKPWSRAYKSEIYGVFQILGSDSVSARNDSGVPGVIYTDTTPVYGAGIGLNVTEHLNVNTEIMLGWMDGKDTSPYWPTPVVYENDSIYLWNVNLDYNILKGRLTPVVSAGAGVLGYNGDNRVHEVHFAGNVGAGIRWDVTDHFAVRVLYRSTWWEMEYADDPSQFDGVTASVIWMLK